MAIYLVEVQAASKQYDVQAQKLAREILLLPTTHFLSQGGGKLPPLNSSSTPAPTVTTPLTIRTSQLYYLVGNLTSAQSDQLVKQLLVDPVVQKATVHLSPAGLPVYLQKGMQEMPFHTVDVFFHPGVTDTLAESVLAGADMLGITGLEQVQTGKRYLLDGRLSETDVHAITGALLYNPVIQRYTLHSAYDRENNRPLAANVHHQGVKELQECSPAVALLHRFPIANMTDQELLELSKVRMLALDLDEMRAIQAYYREQQRESTDVELETLAQTWSEHCSHKTFKGTISYYEVDSDGRVLTEETIPGLLKHYIMRATELVRPSWLVSAFSDNAGIIRFTRSHDVAFKVETHNHPSAIEPFGGANTGVGGVIRDVLGVSAQPIACTDVLCFGPPDEEFVGTGPVGTGVGQGGEGIPVPQTGFLASVRASAQPAGILSPRRIANGVVNGVRDYGNKMGIPTVNGAVLYHNGYLFNPLVFCGCVGVLPHESHPHRIRTGDHIVVIGGRTGRDGIHGATFSSGELSSEINAQVGSAVQIGAPITEKKVADVLVQVRDRGLYSAITDCGAGGFSSAIGEMGAETGVHVELANAPLKYQGLAPWEIWLSEAQERMVLAVPPEHLDELREICTIEEVEVSVIGTFTNDARLVVTYSGQVVADMEMAFLHKGRPQKRLEAVWTVSPRFIVGHSLISPSLRSAAADGHAAAGDQADMLLALLRHPTIGSKEAIVRRYDHEVQGATLLKPLVGRAGNGPGDAAVLQPLLDDQITDCPTPGRDKSGPYAPNTDCPTPGREGIETRSASSAEGPYAPNAGIVIANGINPLYGNIDPYAMATNAIDEALRNLTAVGGDIEYTAILDNFCWGSSTDPTQLGMLVRAVKGCYDAAIGFGVPFISGKDSLNNEYRMNEQRLPVLPTLLISAISVIDNAAQTIDMSLKAAGNLLYQIGTTRNELAGSHYAEVIKGEVQIFASSQATPAPQGGGTDGGKLASLPPLLTTQQTGVPQVDIPAARARMKALGAAIRKGMVQACHDLSEGGLAVAIAEMSLAGLLGVRIDVGRVPQNLAAGEINTLLLFSETASRFLVEIAPAQQNMFEEYLRASGINDFACIGEVTDTGRFLIQNGQQVLIDIPVTALQAAWQGQEADRIRGEEP